MTEKLTENATKGIGFIKSFIQFIKKYGVVGLALGVVIGNAVKTLVDSLVANIISPILGKIIQQGELASWVVWDIKIGSFVSDLINFVILLFIVYLAIKLIIGKLLSDDEKKQLKVD